MRDVTSNNARNFQYASFEIEIILELRSFYICQQEDRDFNHVTHIPTNSNPADRHRQTVTQRYWITQRLRTDLGLFERMTSITTV